MTEPPALPPAGWYPDPTNPGGQRYWDGQRWTEQAAAAPAPTPPPGWYPDPRGGEQQRYWDGSAWTERTQAKARPELELAEGDQLSETVEVEPEPQGLRASKSAASTSPGAPIPKASGPTLGEQLGKAWAQAGGQVGCPGCQTTTGSPGALCPSCGSRYPSPRGAMVGIAAALLGSLFLLIAYIATGHLLHSKANGHTDVGTLETLGWLLGIVGVGMVVYSVGRSGPQKQTSCCGCSCAVALIVIPAAGWVLWTAGGPLLAAVVIPAWVPLSWILEYAAQAWRFTSIRCRSIATGTATLRKFVPFGERSWRRADTSSHGADDLLGA